MRKNIFKLRSSIQPYVGFLLIYAFMLIFTIGSLSFSGDFKDALILATILTLAFLLFFTFWGFINMGYQIFLEGDTVNMRTATFFNSSPTHSEIKIVDITSIKQETSDPHTAAKMRRPFRRIALYNEHDGKWIDVSLKHFVMRDIRTLMKKIQEKRPDLKVPFANL